MFDIWRHECESNYLYVGYEADSSTLTCVSSTMVRFCRQRRCQFMENVCILILCFIIFMCIFMFITHTLTFLWRKCSLDSGAEQRTQTWREDVPNTESHTEPPLNWLHFISHTWTVERYLKTILILKKKSLLPGSSCDTMLVIFIADTSTILVIILHLCCVP